MKAICVCTALIVLAGLGAIRPGPSAAGRDTPEESATESRPASVVAGEKGPSADAEEPGKREPSRHSGSRPADDEAYVDMKRLFDEEPGFKAGREQLKRSLSEGEVELDRLARELRSLSAQQQDADSEGQTDLNARDRLRRELVEAKVNLESKRESLKNMALEREAELYRVTYERIRAAVGDYARENGIRIVRRKQAAVSERLEGVPKPQDMIRLMNQDIVFNADEPRDITEPVLELLKVRAAAAQ